MAAASETIQRSNQGRNYGPYQAVQKKAYGDQGFTRENLGGAEGIRTPDLCSAIAALSHLSYSPEALAF